MKMNSCLYIIPSRAVRALSPYHFRAPWPFVKKVGFFKRDFFFSELYRLLATVGPWCTCSCRGHDSEPGKQKSLKSI